MIRIASQRFGTIERRSEDVLYFPGGIFGFELQQKWLMLGDREHGGLYWLQSVEQAELSLAVVDPREFVAGYALHVPGKQLASLWNSDEPLVVVAVLTEYERSLCLNLRNPIVINQTKHLGRQVVASGDRPAQFVLSDQAAPLKKSA